MKNGTENAMRKANSVIASTYPKYASLTNIVLAEKPSAASSAKMTPRNTRDLQKYLVYDLP